jgi:hypothetical protein
MTELALRILLAAALLVVCWWLWAIEYRRYRILLLKNYLFEARDELFTAALRKRLSFDDPAYGMTRTILNGMLRQAEALSLPHMTGMMLTRFWWSNTRIEYRFNAQFERAQTQLTEDGRAAVRKALDQAHVAIVSHMLHISLTLGPVVQAWKLWYAWRNTARQARVHRPAWRH